MASDTSESAPPDRPRRIRAVIFDMDGLLFDSEVYWARARTEFCRAQNCSWTGSDEDSVKGHNSVEWAAKMKARCHLEFDSAEIIQAVSERMRALYHEHLPLLSGAVDVVRSLALTFPLGLASSSPTTLIEIALQEAGIRSCFTVVVSADDVGRGKPSPDVFLEAAERLGYPPAEIAVFEDSSAGIRAGRSAETFVIAVPNQHYPPAKEALQQADIVLPSLTGFSIDMLP